MRQFLSTLKDGVPLPPFMMERKIGEIFEYKGEWYQRVEGAGCYQCAFNRNEDTCTADNPHCTCRSDKKDVVFKKIEKVGEPFVIEKVLYQHYKVFDIDNVCGDGFWCVHNYKAKILTIEIKQNKEDMKIDKVVMNIDDKDYLLDRLEAILHDTHCQQYKDEICEALSKYIVTETALSLKPFDLDTAKSGKPVCTRDGRKARIICFDRKSETPITVLVTEINGIEAVYSYPNNGIWDSPENTNGCDLMMLPEKKEMWINIYRGTTRLVPGGYLYDTEEEAKDAVEGAVNYLTTVKVCWEE